MALTKVTGEFIDIGDIDISNVGSIQLDSIAGDADTNTTIAFPGSDVITMSTGGSERLRVDASGRVGIGTASPSALLTIDGGNSADDNTPKLVIEGANAILRLGDGQVSNGGPHGIQFDYEGTGVTSGMSMYYRTDPEYISFEDSDDNSGSKVMVITKTGNVGIGTSSPSYLLDISGDSRVRVTGTNASNFGAYEAENNAGVGAFFGMGGNGRSDILDNRAYALGQSSSDGLVIVTEGSDPILFAVSGIATSDEVMRIDSSGNVGIGTTSPDRSLHITETTGGKIRLERDDTTLGAGNTLGIIEFETNDTDAAGVAATFSAVGESGAGAVGFQFTTGTASSNSERLRIDSSGNVGIGTTSPSYPLVVSDGGGLGFEFSPDHAGGGYNMLQNYNRSGSAYVPIRYVASQHEFINGGSEVARIDSSGKVGIGTTSPSALLHAHGTTEEVIRLDSGDTGAIHFFEGATRRGIIGYSNGTSIASAADAGDMVFRVESGKQIHLAVSATSKLTVDSSGKVGIGTSSPSDDLEISSVLATIRLTDSDGGYHRIRGNDAHLIFQADDGNTQADSSIRFQIDGTERMRIDSTGRLLVGETSGSQRLLVSDNANDNTVLKVRNSGNSTPYGQVIEFSGAAPDDNTRYFLRCGDTGANRMHIYSDGDVNTSDAGTLTSDRSLKTDIADATSKLADVNQLQVRNFKWITDYHPNKQNKHIGFIADEFETVFPSLVVEHENPIVGQDGTVKSVRYGALIPILVKALQEADDKIDALEARITELESS